MPTSPNLPERLRASPNFSLNQSMDGRCFAAGEVEPYPQFWLTERERLLFSLFGRRGGMKPGEAIEAMVHLSGATDGPAERRRIERAIAGMHEAGVLIDPAGELSRYGKAMARDYLDHRPFPKDVAARIVEVARIEPSSTVLDLASGPGSLALELAGVTPHVSIMELSRGFVAAARAEAKRRGVQLQAFNESANRLPQHDGTYDAITISQALHWLDDVALCKGICRTLAPGGSFVVVHGALTLPDRHPLSYILGDVTPLGDKQRVAFADEVRPLFRRLALLFEALDAPEVARHDPLHARQGAARIGGQGIELFRQKDGRARVVRVVDR